MTATALDKFAEQMQAFQRASGVPARTLLDRQRRQAGLPELGSINDWRRRCAASQRRSDERRQLSPHPWPQKGHVIATFLLAALIAALAWLFLVATVADFS